MRSSSLRSRETVERSLLAFMLFGAVVACSGGESRDATSPPEGETSSTPPDETTVAEVEQGAEDSNGEPSVVDDLPEGSSPTSTLPAFGGSELSGLQEEILADGVVTEEEMFLAMEATVACIERQGFIASLSETSPGMWSVTTSAQDSAEMSQANEATDVCMAQYSDAAQMRYAVGRLPPETDLDVIWECLLDRGVLDGSETDPTIAFQMAEATDAGATWECIRLGRDG